MMSWHPLPQHTREKFLLMGGASLLLPLLGFFASYLATGMISNTQHSTIYSGLIVLVTMALLLAIPLGILALMCYAAHVIHPEKRVLGMENLPMDPLHLHGFAN